MSQTACCSGGREKKSLLKIPLKILDPCHLSDIMISLGFESSALLPLSKTLNECKQLLASEHHWPFSVCCTHPGEHMYEKHGQYVSMYYKKYICAVFSWPNLVKNLNMTIIIMIIKNTVTLIKIFHSTACIDITQQDVTRVFFQVFRDLCYFLCFRSLGRGHAWLSRKLSSFYLIIIVMTALTSFQSVCWDFRDIIPFLRHAWNVHWNGFTIVVSFFLVLSK